MLFLEGPQVFRVPKVTPGPLEIYTQGLGGLAGNRQLIKLQEKGTPSIRPERSRKLQIGTSGTRRGNRYRR